MRERKKKDSCSINGVVAQVTKKYRIKELEDDPKYSRGSIQMTAALWLTRDCISVQHYGEIMRIWNKISYA